MSLRQHVPKALHPALGSAYLRLGAATSGARMMPEVIVAGGQRCGTTSLFKNLAEHPQLLRPAVEKGIDYFSLHYGEDLDWYRGHFPLARPASVRTRSHGRPVAFEACTYYMFHPFAFERIARDLPGTKVVVMLRDPVERAFSAYKHEYARGFETVPDFAESLALEDERLAGEEERMAADVRYESFAHRHHAYRRRGQYAEQLERAYQHFPREQVHVVESEAYFARPEVEYRRLLDFLGLAEFVPARFDRHNARPSSPMPGRTRELLAEHYAPYDDKLAALLGRPLAWMT